MPRRRERPRRSRVCSARSTPPPKIAPASAASCAPRSGSSTGAGELPPAQPVPLPRNDAQPRTGLITSNREDQQAAPTSVVPRTGTAAAGYSRMTAAVPGPLILAKDGQSSGPARAELAFHRTRDATCRVPRAGRLSGWTMHTPAADTNAARRASRTARQTAQVTSSHPDERDRAGGVGSCTRPRVTMVMRARCGDGGQIVSRSGAGRGVGVARPAHSSHRRGQ